MKSVFSIFLTVFVLFCSAPTLSGAQNVLCGADQTDCYLPLLKDKKVALLVNQTSVIRNAEGGYTHLADSLISLDIDVRFLMAPEHGIKGLVSAGDTVGDSHYEKKKNLTVYSLYGKTKKPQAEWLKEVDVVVFDIQDVGCRFYTYLSTLKYLLEACGEQQKEVLVLDRPNPNDTVDGPMLKPAFRSFVGMVEVPLLHGCTLGEMAQMMIGEGWIGEKKPRLTVIPCSGWNRNQPYSLPIAPSPNLRTDHAIRLYASLCLFEATDISVGRGTDWPFEVLGHPSLKGDFSFTPRNCTAATNPLQKNKLCHGFDLRETEVPTGFHLDWLICCIGQLGPSCIKQPSFFDKLAGNDSLRLMISEKKSEKAIRDSWQKELTEYRSMREKYLIYR